MGPPWVPPDSERAVGLAFYLTETPGVPATIKRTPDDFEVHEISAHPPPDPAGEHAILRLISRNWEQHDLSRRLARDLRLPPQAIRWAGTKDRRAVAERLASYRGRPPEQLEIPGVELVEAYRARDGLVLGHHFGNRFRIRLSVAHSDAMAASGTVADTLAAIGRLGGFANLFGPQRFGEVRPVTHDVGRALVRGDVGGAVETYLTARPPGGDLVGAEARSAYASHHEAERALREFPPGFTFERLLLEHLARGHSPERALRALPRELRVLFVHAFQSLVFNRWLSARYAAGGSLTEPAAGDFVLRVGRDGTVRGTEAVAVDRSNADEVRDTVRRGGARLAGPLVGYDTPDGDGDTLRALDAVLAEEGVERRAFRLPASPDLASAGSWRPVWVDRPPIAVAPECDPTRSADTEDGLWLEFALPKGTYATVLLRELTKTGATAASR